MCSFNFAGLYPVSVNARNNISSANASSVISVLEQASVAWREKPPTEVNVGVPLNFSVVINGTNVTVTVDFGDGSPVYEKLYESALNTVMNITHK